MLLSLTYNFVFALYVPCCSLEYFSNTSVWYNSLWYFYMKIDTTTYNSPTASNNKPHQSMNQKKKARTQYSEISWMGQSKIYIYALSGLSPSFFSAFANQSNPQNRSLLVRFPIVPLFRLWIGAGWLRFSWVGRRCKFGKRRDGGEKGGGRGMTLSGAERRSGRVGRRRRRRVVMRSGLELNFLDRKPISRAPRLEIISEDGRENTKFTARWKGANWERAYYLRN